MAFAAAVPMVWAGAIGPVVVTVLDAPTAPSPTTLLGTPRDAETTMVPPEFAGFSTAFKTLLPVVISAVGTDPGVRRPIRRRRRRVSDDHCSAIGAVHRDSSSSGYGAATRGAPRYETFLEEGRAARA